MEENGKKSINISTVLFLISIVIMIYMGISMYNLKMNYIDHNQAQLANQNNSNSITNYEEKDSISFEKLMTNLYRRQNPKFNDLREIDFDYYINYDDENDNLLGLQEFSLSGGSDDRFSIMSRHFTNSKNKALISNYLVVTDFPEKIVDQIVRIDSSEEDENSYYSGDTIPPAQILLLTESGSVYHAENIKLEKETGTFYTFDDAPFKIKKYDEIERAIKISEAAFNDYEDDYLPVQFLVTTFDGNLYRCNGDKIVKIEE